MHVILGINVLRVMWVVVSSVVMENFHQLPAEGGEQHTRCDRHPVTFRF